MASISEDDDDEEEEEEEERGLAGEEMGQMRLGSSELPSYALII